MRTPIEAEARLLSIEAALNEMWGLYRHTDLVDTLTTEQVIVRIVAMRSEACRETLTLLLDKHAAIVDTALRVGQRSLLVRQEPQ